MEDIQFEEIYKKYYKRIFCYIKKHILSAEDAEEMTEDIFMNFYKSRFSYDQEKGSLETWLFVITNNRLKNYYRDRKKEVLMEVMEFGCVPVDMSAEEAVLLSHMREEILCAIKKLSGRERAILIKKFYQGKTSKQIAEELQITDGNVRVIAKRSLSKLKKILKDRLD